VLRRVALIQAGKAAGIPLERIREALDTLPAGKSPTRRDWERLSSSWRRELDERIATLEAIRGRLTTCIGCGCLSLQRCRLLNTDDEAAGLGAGAHYLRSISPRERRVA
jgi:MerR family redox-sensitive transcriptional activator SoxR